MSHTLYRLVLIPAVLTICSLLSLFPVSGQNRLAVTRSSSRLNYPPAKRVDQIENYHGIEVADPYRWLEEMHSKETEDWVAQQDQLLKEMVGEASVRGGIKRRLAELVNYDMYAATRFIGQTFKKEGKSYFYVVTGARKNQPVLYVQEGLNSRPRTLLDLHSRYGDDKLQLVGFSPSPDGRFVAYQVSKDLSNWVSLRLLDVATGKDIQETLEGLHFLGGTVSWTHDGNGFFYTQFDSPEAGAEQRSAVKNPRIYFHVRGAQQKEDQLVHAAPENPGLLYSHRVTADGRYLVVAAFEGSSNKNIILYKDLRLPNSALKPLIGEADADYKLIGSSGSRFWFYTDLEAARGRIIAIDINKPRRSNWSEVIPEAAESISGRSNVGGNALGMYGDRFVLVYLRDGRPLLRVFDTQGRLLTEQNFPEGSSIWGGFSGRQQDTEVFFRLIEFASPGTIYRLNVVSGERRIFKRAVLKLNSADYVVKQVFYRSKDGTRVPMFIAHQRRVKLDGTNPTFMYGYGAFGWIAFTWFQPNVIAWLEMGGIYALPAIRGGGEYGEDWHQAGIKLNRQNAIDDYIAAAEWLIDNRYTSSSRLVANGGSASGAVAAAAVLQRSDLFGASVIDIAVLDLVRFDKFTAASYWKPEFGSPADANQFKALYSYSPYHNLRSGKCYPPTLVMTGERDQTAVPLHSYKFIAAMQTAQACDNPVLLKVMRETGHNFGSTPERRVESWTDMLVFLYRVLNLSSP